MFQSFFGLLGFSRSRRTVRRQPARFRPSLEPLGERCLPCAGLSASPAPSLAGLVADAGHSHDQPFHLSGAGTFTPTSSTDVTFTASGTATALGQWTNYGELHFNGTQGTGVAVFTASNGDVLVARIVGTIDFATGAATGTFTFVSSATLQDGITIVTSAGRFADVSGSADLNALGFPNFTFTLDGDMAHAASQQDGHHDDFLVSTATRSAGQNDKHCGWGGVWYKGHCIDLYY